MDKIIPTNPTPDDVEECHELYHAIRSIIILEEHSTANVLSVCCMIIGNCYVMHAEDSMSKEEFLERVRRSVSNAIDYDKSS